MEGYQLRLELLGMGTGDAEGRNKRIARSQPYEEVSPQQVQAIVELSSND
jgi:hypothetical protein